MKMEQFVISSQMYKAWFLNFEMEITFYSDHIEPKIRYWEEDAPENIN